MDLLSERVWTTEMEGKSFADIWLAKPPEYWVVIGGGVQKLILWTPTFEFQSISYFLETDVFG